MASYLATAPHRGYGGGGTLIALVVVTMPLVGVHLWVDYAGQASRAANPDWIGFGHGLASFLPASISVAVTGISLLAAMFAPRRAAGAWLGLLVIVGLPTLRVYDLMYLLPALLRLRRGIALVAVLMDVVPLPAGIWVSVVIIATAMLMGLRFNGLYEAASLEDEASQLR